MILARSSACQRDLTQGKKPKRATTKPKPIRPRLVRIQTRRLVSNFCCTGGTLRWSSCGQLVRRPSKPPSVAGRWDVFYLAHPIRSGERTSATGCRMLCAFYHPDSVNHLLVEIVQQAVQPIAPSIAPVSAVKGSSHASHTLLRRCNRGTSRHRLASFRRRLHCSRRCSSRQGDEAPPGTQLSIGQVVLFSSGVGYFAAKRAADARVDLSFPVSDINDLIKPMVLRDLDVVSTAGLH